MSVAMTSDETDASEKDEYDGEFDVAAESDDAQPAELCDASFSHTCAYTI